MPLVLLVRRHDDGLIEIEATSSENLLWAELQRVPERTDGSIAGNGPAARALRTGAPAEVAVTDEGFFPWRNAARREHINGAIACPLCPASGDRALVVFHTRAGPSAKELTPVSKALEELCGLIDRREQDVLLGAALKQSGNPAFIADGNGIIIWCNAAFCQLSGYREEELLGRNPRVLSSGEHGVSHYRELWSTILSGRIWRGESVDRNRDGDTFTAMQTISPIRIQGRIENYLAVYHDVTQDKDEEELRELRSGVDALTGLMYRAPIEQQIHADLAKGSNVSIARVTARALVVLDALGIDASAAFCEELEERMRSLIDSTRIARLSAGDYLVWLPEDADTSGQVEQSLRTRLREPYPFFGDLPAVDLRLGFAQGPRDGRTLRALLKHADEDLDQSSPLG